LPTLGGAARVYCALFIQGEAVAVLVKGSKVLGAVVVKIAVVIDLQQPAHVGIDGLARREIPVEQVGQGLLRKTRAIGTAAQRGVAIGEGVRNDTRSWGLLFTRPGVDRRFIQQGIWRRGQPSFKL